MTSSRWLERLSSAKIAILLFFAIALLVGALPSYLQGRLPSASTIGEVQLKSIKAILTDGLTIDGWQNLNITELELGSYTWLQQTVRGEETTPYAQREALLFVHPQQSPSGTSSLPQTEWSDIEGVLSRQGHTKLDSWQWLSFGAASDATTSPKVKAGTIHARFYRIVTPQQTYAAVSWYDWSEGGHYSGAHWFMADLWAQIAGTRQPWAAVALLIPIEVRGEIAESRELATSLARSIHVALLDAGLAEASP
jgi:cyanoexosortase B-associated protein